MPERITLPGRTVTAPTLRVDKLETEIDKSITKVMKQRLGLRSNQKLPEDVQATIRAAAATATQASLENAIVREASELATGTARGSVLDRFDVKVNAARAGLDHIAGSSDVKKILTRRAEMLAMKKQTLEKAGFTTEEAMEIILADIAARG
jgi:translation initiation factor 2 alpha subunit (eIF-2alpha)